MKSVNCILLVCLLGLVAHTEETQEQQVERLIRELQDGDSNVRSNAAYALSSIGEGAVDAVPALIQLLQDKGAERFVRVNVVLALSSIGAGAVDAVPALRQLLQDKDLYVRRIATEALESIGAPDTLEVLNAPQKQKIERLIGELQDQDWDIRNSAAMALGQIGKDALPSLIQLLQDQDWGVRDLAAMALGQIGKDAVPPLIQLLQDQDWDIRNSAAMALGQISMMGTSDAIKAAKDAISALNQALQDENVKVRMSAEQALGRINVSMAQGLLKEGLSAEAIAVYEKLIETHPDDSSYIWQLGDAYRQVGGPKKAIESFERLLEAHPENPDLLSQLVQLYQETNNQQKIAGIRDKLLANFDAADLNTGMLCGQLLTQAGQHQEAKRIYEAIIQKHPTEPYIKQVLISVYRQLGENEKAKAILGEMKTNLNPNDPYDSMAYAQGLLHGNWFVKQIYTEAYRNNEKETIDIMAALNITNFKFYFKQWCDITMTFGGTTSEIGLALWKMKDGYLELPSSLGNYKITFSNETTALLEYTEGGYVDQTLPPSSDFFQYIQNYYDVDNEDETRTLFLELERDSYQDHLVR